MTSRSARRAKLLGLAGPCVIRFSRPLDCFGNYVDDEGTSHDARGRVVDATTYVLGRDGRPCLDHVRDAEYTRELGDRIVEAFQEDTVVMATHVVATCAFERLRRAGGKADLFAVLRHRDDVSVPRAELAEDVDVMLSKLQQLEERGKIAIAPGLAHRSANAVVDDALRAFAGYHTQEVLTPRGSELVLRDTRLLFYYQNRLAAHGLAFDAIAPKGTTPAHIRAEAPKPSVRASVPPPAPNANGAGAPA